jgi:hypothetical protein
MMRILEILLPKGTSDKSLSPQALRRIDMLQKRMDSYVDKIMDPKTSKAGKEFLKSRLRDDYEDLRDTLPQIEESSQLNELFDAPVDWEWTETAGERATAIFNVEGKPYTFTAILQDEETGTWGIVFQQKEKATPAQAKAAKDKTPKGNGRFIAPPTETGVLGTGNSAIVFSTIVDILKEFVRNYQPVNLIFSAEPESRARLYTHIVKRLVPDAKIIRSGAMFMVKLNSELEESVQINELLDAPVEWEWDNTGPSRALAHFQVGKYPYRWSATLDDTELKSWIILFRVDGTQVKSHEYAILGTGNAATVFSTVIDILRDFLNQYKGMVDRLVFSADEPSRKKLYYHLIKRVLPDSTTEVIGNDIVVTLPHAVENNLTEWKKSTTYDKAAKGTPKNPKGGFLTCDKCGQKFSRMGIGKHRCFPKSTVNEAVTRIPITNDDFKLVMKVMERPIPAAIAPIYISQIIEDDELNDQLFSLEDSQPGLDVRPIIAEWFNRIMPDQMYRFTGDEQTPAQKNGVLSPIHGYDSHNYKGTNDPITGDAYGFR